MAFRRVVFKDGDHRVTVGMRVRALPALHHLPALDGVVEEIVDGLRPYLVVVTPDGRKWHRRFDEVEPAEMHNHGQ